MKLSDLQSLDIRVLPDEVVKALYTVLHKEVSRRRRAGMAATYKGENLNRVLCHSIGSPHRKRAWSKIESQDWSDVYPEHGGDKKFYVYAHIDPMSKHHITIGDFRFSGIPFYIGKGTGSRAWDLKRNEGHGAELRRLKKCGVQPESIVYIVKDGLTESEALCLEAKLIYFFGTRFSNEKNGVLVNLEVPKVGGACYMGEIR